MTVTDLDRLILIRHAMPEIDPQNPAERWHLGNEGRTAARTFRPLLAESAYYVASTELKAIETLQEVASDLNVLTDPGFAEVRRSHRWSGTSYRAEAHAYVEGVPHDGWEPCEAVIDRFGAAVARHAALAAACNQALIIGTHGLAMTIWLASRYSLHPSSAQFWAALRFPDIIDVHHTVGIVSRRPR